MQQAEKLSITLPVEMVRVIRDKVGSGAYSSNSEVIREALRGWLEHEQLLKNLDMAIARGIADAESERVHDVEGMREDLKRHFIR